jgi:hypothetical protein
LDLKITTREPECGIAGVSDSFISYDGREGILPKKVMEWAELTEETVEYDRTTGKSLIQLNDSGQTFSEIADVIWEKL